MTFKSALSNVGNGLLTATAAIHNSSIQLELDEVNTEIARLQERKAELERRLIAR